MSFFGGLQDALANTLGGFNRVRLMREMGPDYQEQLDQREFERQRSRQQAEQQDEQFAQQQDAAMQAQLADAITGQPQGNEQGPLPETNLESLIPAQVTGARRARLIAGARGQV